MAAAFAEWTASHTGRLALVSRLSPLGWVRIPENADVFTDGSPDPTAGRNSPHVEFFFGGISPQNDSTGIGNPPPLTLTRVIKSKFVNLEERQEGNISLGMIVVNLHPIARGPIFKPTPSLAEFRA